MKNRTAADCPVSFLPINQNKVRLIAFFVFVLSAAYVLFPHWSLAGLLVTDFFLRSFGMGRYSFLAAISDWIIRKFSIRNKPVDSGPKEFAAMIGFIISDILFITSSLFHYDAGVYFAGLLICFSFLEAAFGFCAGCYLHSLARSFLHSGSHQNTASS
ncbi:MAG TPA: DUF4395 domain-containing protein [Flavisolibacter sp.]|jgi:hypothetical protein